MADIDIGYAINYQYINLIDITPSESTPTWAWVGPGITEITPEREEKVESEDTYATGGNSVTTVKGVDKTLQVSGSRLVGDPFQDFLVDIEEAFGTERETTYRVVNPTGEIIEEDVTIKDVIASGPNGAASDKQSISCTFARNDTPRIIEPAKGTHLPSQVTADAVSVKVGQTQQVTPTVTPDTASGWCLYAVEDTSVARVTADGKVEGLKAGSTKLAIKCAAKPAVRVSVDVTVTA